MKLGKTAKNRLKMKGKAEILAQENSQKLGKQLQRGTLHPCLSLVPVCYFCTGHSDTVQQSSTQGYILTGRRRKTSHEKFWKKNAGINYVSHNQTEQNQ